jgi:hypothetical protein
MFSRNSDDYQFGTRTYAYLKTQVPELDNILDALAQRGKTLVGQLGSKVRHIQAHICAH